MVEDTQHSFSLLSDGFDPGEVQRIQAELGWRSREKSNGELVLPIRVAIPRLTPNDASPRWVGSGWTVFNNKSDRFASSITFL